MKSTRRATIVAVAVASLLAASPARCRARPRRAGPRRRRRRSRSASRRCIPGSTPAAIEAVQQPGQGSSRRPTRPSRSKPVEYQWTGPTFAAKLAARHAADRVRGAVHRRPDARRQRPARRPDRARSRRCRTSRSSTRPCSPRRTTSKGKIVALPKGAYAQALHYNREALQRGRASTRTSRRRRGRRCGRTPSRSREKTGKAGYAQMAQGRQHRRLDPDDARRTRSAAG